MEIDHKEKVTYEAFNPREWKETRFVISNFPPSIKAKDPNFPAY